MNEIIHFATGYLFARILKKKYNQFESLYIAFAAIIVDIDFLIGKFLPEFEHGVMTHTILGCFIISLILAGSTRLFIYFFPRSMQISFFKLFGFAFLGTLSHLLLDAFTYLPDDPIERASEIDHHMYFWPISVFPVHINTIFPFASYDIRVAIEVIFSSFVGIYIMIYMGFIKKQVFLECFNPKKWNFFEKTPPTNSQWLYLVLMLVIILLALLSGYI